MKTEDCCRRRRIEPCAGFAVSRLERTEFQARCRLQLVCPGSVAGRQVAQFGVGANRREQVHSFQSAATRASAGVHGCRPIGPAAESSRAGGCGASTASIDRCRCSTVSLFNRGGNAGPLRRCGCEPSSRGKIRARRSQPSHHTEEDRRRCGGRGCRGCRFRGFGRCTVLL